MARGGARQGKPGKAYSSRTDLNAPKPEQGINRPAPGQTYGTAQAQQNAMQAVPIQTPQAPDMMGAATDWQPLPGSPTQTSRPNEPVTAGLEGGPGPGPEALPQITAPPDEDMQRLIRQLPLLEQLANNTGSSVQTRNLYRQVLGAYLQQQGGL